MKTVLVINEKDEDGDIYTIGVADSVASANEIIDEYYGPHEVVEERDIRDSNLEFEKRIKLYCPIEESFYETFIWTEWFTLNKL